MAYSPIPTVPVHNITIQNSPDEDQANNSYSAMASNMGNFYQDQNEETVRSWKSVFSWRTSGKGSSQMHSQREISIVSESTNDIRIGSNKFRFLAKQIYMGLDIHSPKQAKKVAKRIFEAFSPATANLIRAFHENQEHIPDNVIKSASGLEVTDSIGLHNIGLFSYI